LGTDAKLFDTVDQLQWRGPTPAFETFTKKVGDQKLLERANAAAAKIGY
jgi:hypothetical protein